MSHPVAHTHIPRASGADDADWHASSCTASFAVITNDDWPPCSRLVMELNAKECCSYNMINTIIIRYNLIQ